MSAEVLREAAALMREKAMRACPDGVWYDQHDLHEALIPLADSVDDPEADATHIASWHPAVALAVADWLDSAARGWLTEQDRQWGLVLLGHDWQIPEGTAERNELQRRCDDAADVRFKKALAVASAYLGEVTA
jgi:hypothetical protein